MKLYYSPFACSLAAHIACLEAGIEPELVRVDLPSKRTASGTDLFAENPMGQVPTLVIDDGRVLVESVAVLSYLNDLASSSADRGGLPADRYELLRWLGFVATELHKKVLWPIYAPTSPDPIKEHARASAGRALDVVSAHLEAREALCGASFSVADAYLFWALTLLPHAGVPLDDRPVLKRYLDRHRGRPAVKQALRLERAELERPFAA